MVVRNFMIGIVVLFVAAFFGWMFNAGYVLPLAAGLMILSIVISLRFPTVYLVLLVLIHEEFFQTFDLGMAHWFYRDLALVFLLVGIAAQLSRNKFWIDVKGMDRYAEHLLFLLGIVFMSIFIGSWLIHKQPLNTLIFRPRGYFLYLVFLYLYLARFSVTQIKKFIHFVIWSAFIVSFLVIVDAAILGGNKIFVLAMSNGISGHRAGHVRIYTYTFLTTLAYFLVLAGLRDHKTVFVKLIFFVIWTVICFQLVFCNMTRQLLLMLLLSTTIFFLNLRPLPKIMIGALMGVLLTGGAIYFFNNSGSLKDRTVYKLVHLTKYETLQTYKSNIFVRLKGIEFYYPYFAETGYLGMGMMAVTDKKSPMRWGLMNGYNFSDLGLFSTIFRFGLGSIIFILVFLRKIFKDLAEISQSDDREIRMIATGFVYFFICQVVVPPLTTIFFNEHTCLLYGILIYMVYKMKHDLLRRRAEDENISRDGLLQR